jgi:hypothetical protein
MNYYQIQTDRDENGLWGLPLSLRKIDKMVKLDDETTLLFSAICISLMEKFNGERFEIFWNSSSGFFVKFINSGYYNIRYSDYKLDGNVLLFSKVLKTPSV